MAPSPQRPKLLVIVGPTASGKSALALKIAQKYGGEIICADSRTVYKGMDIGTAKPTPSEQDLVPHWGLDLAEPGERFTAAMFQKYAEDKINDITNRGKLPILVGGSGLYIDSVLYDFKFRRDIRPLEREGLEKLTTDQLRAKIKHMGYRMPQNDKNRRHLIRTLEARGQESLKSPDLPPGTVLIGILPPDEMLMKRIANRAELMFKHGIIEETLQLINRHGQEALADSAGIIYRSIIRLIQDEISQEQAKELFKTADWQYARRQRTWFKRNPHIKWFATGEDAYVFLTK